MTPDRQCFLHTLFWTLFLSTTAANARIVNTQDTLFSISEDGLHLHSDISTDWLTGTAEVLQFSGALGSEWLREPHLVFLSASGTLAQKDNERFINKYFGHLRYRYAIWKMIMLEAFVQGEYNEFRRLLVRMPCGIGPRIRYDIGEKRLFQIALGTSYMFELVYLSKDRDEDGVEYEDSLSHEYNHRWNNYLAVKLNVDFLSLGATVYVQPLFADFDNYMILLESSLTFTVTENLSVAFSYILFHDSAPPQGVINRDTALKALLKMTFGPWFSKVPKGPPSNADDGASGG